MWQVVSERSGGSVTSLESVGEKLLALTAAGLRISHDRGRSWEIIGAATSPPLEILVAGLGVLWAGSAQGLFRSADGGRTWSSVLVGSRVLSIAFASEHGVLVGTEDDGLLRSQDDGRTWTSGNAGLQDLTVVGVAWNPDVAYAATPTGLFRSRNAGVVWRSVDTLPPNCVPQCLAASGSRVLVGTEAHGLLISADHGVTWRAELEHAGVVALAAEGERILAATDAGLALSLDSGANWRVHAAEYGPVLTVAFAADGTLVAGLRRQGVLRSRDAMEWELSTDGLAANLVVALTSTAEGLFRAGLEDGIELSRDGGATWLPEWQTDVAVFALSPEARYAATAGGVLRREGASWREVQPTPVRAVSCSGANVAALGVADELLVSEDAGASWRTLSPPTVPTCCALDAWGALLVGSDTGVWRADSAWRKIVDAPKVRTMTVAADGLVLMGGDDYVLHGSTRHQLGGTVTSMVSTAGVVAIATTTGLWLLERDITTQHLENRPMVAAAFSSQAVYAAELGGRIWRRARS